MLHEQERKNVAETALTLLASGLVVNTSGNVSVRIGQQVAITPSGKAYESLDARDVVIVDLEGETIDGDLLPSSETPLHLSLYKADASIAAIVHTHSVYATAVSTLVSTLPPIHYQIITLGGPVPVAPYATFGTAELAANVTSTMAGRSAALMQNHGAITTGSSLEQALTRTYTLEWICEVYLTAAQSGDPSLLDDAELQRVAEQMQKLAAEQSRRLAARDS